jgi:hypothetical protein
VSSDASLSRRELRERERALAEAALSPEDTLALEMERQLARIRPSRARAAALGKEAPAPAPTLSREVSQPEAATKPSPAAAPVTPVAAVASAAKKPRAPRPPKPARMAKRTSKSPPTKNSSPSRRRRGARIFTVAAMLFIAGIALATSIPAAALLTPEQVAMQNEQARIKFAALSVMVRASVVTAALRQLQGEMALAWVARQPRQPSVLTRISGSKFLYPSPTTPSSGLSLRLSMSVTLSATASCSAQAISTPGSISTCPTEQKFTQSPMES